MANFYESKLRSRQAHLQNKPNKFHGESNKNKTTTLSYVLEKIQDGYYEVDLSGNFEKFNEAMRQIIGLEKEEIVGLNYKKFIVPDDIDKVFKVFNKVYRTGIPSQAFDWKIRRSDGSIRYVETSVSLKKSRTGEPKGFLGIARDVTRAKLADQARRDSEMLYRSFLESSPDPIVIYDMDGFTRYVNHAFEATFGWSIDELLGKRIDFVPPEHVQETQEAIQELKAGKVVTLFETRRITKTGDILDVQLSSGTFLDSNKNQNGIIVILRDITDFKCTRFALAESENKFSTLVQESPYGISIIDSFGKYKYLNRKFIEMFGYTLKDIPDGKTWFILAFPDWAERKRAIDLWKAEHQEWKPGETKPYIRKVRCKNGNFKIIRFRPVIMPDGNYYISYEDITESEKAKKNLVKTHKELKKSHEQLKSIEKIKEKAIDHLCHELRTPIAVLDANLRILSKTYTSGASEKFLEQIERGQRCLQRLKNIQIQMDDIAQYSKVYEQDLFSNILQDVKDIRESLDGQNIPLETILYPLLGKIEYRYKPKNELIEKIDFTDLVNRQIRLLQPSSSDRKIKILSKVYAGIELYINRTILEIIVNGLLKNAIENTPDGGLIVIKAKETNFDFSFEIIDFGVGITEENQRNLFWGFFHTQDTKHYSTKKPFEFNAGGCGGDLLRMKLFADRLGFLLAFKSRRCKYLLLGEKSCPGNIAKCYFVRSGKECMKSGGTKFMVTFPKEKFFYGPAARNPTVSV